MRVDKPMSRSSSNGGRSPADRPVTPTTPRTPFISALGHRRLSDRLLSELDPDQLESDEAEGCGISRCLCCVFKLIVVLFLVASVAAFASGGIWTSSVAADAKIFMEARHYGPNEGHGHRFIGGRRKNASAHNHLGRPSARVVKLDMAPTGVV